MLPTVRAVALTNYIEVARFVGVEPFAMLREARIDPRLLEDPEARIPAKRAIDMLADTAEKSGCASLGLLMTECRSAASIGGLSLLLVHQPTVRDMIDALIRYQRHLNDIVRIRIVDDGECAIIHCGLDPSVARAVATEMTVSLAYRVLTEFSRPRWRPECAHFAHRAPSDLSAYRRFFQCHLEFEAGFDGFTCASALLDLQNEGADPQMVRNAGHLLKSTLPPPLAASLADRVRSVIYLVIHQNGATVQRVSDNLGIHPRSLQRELGKEGTSFAMLLNEARRELALRYLSSEERAIEAIAILTGYSSQSAFSRWFAAEFGTSPATWRAQNQPPHTP